MIIDTSAFLAILFKEEEQDAFLSLIEQDDAPMMSTASYLEASIRIYRLENNAMPGLFQEVFDKLGIVLVPFSKEQAIVARAAYGNFGKGTGHPAQLNFGDCFTYALAKTTNLPLLFKGDDFIHTDLNLIR